MQDLIEDYTLDEFVDSFDTIAEAFAEIARRIRSWIKFKGDPSRTPDVGVRFPRAFELCKDFEDVLALENLRLEIGDHDFEFYLDLECRSVEESASVSSSVSTTTSTTLFDSIRNSSMSASIATTNHTILDSC